MPADTHRKGFNGPHNKVFLWDVLGIACAGFKFGGVCVTGHGHSHFHIIGHRLLFKLALGLKTHDWEEVQYNPLIIVTHFIMINQSVWKKTECVF